MKNKFLKILIISVFVVASLPSKAEEQNTTVATEQVIKPELDRRDIKVPRIDAEDFELGIFVGILSIEDFGSSTVLGGRLAYHVTEDFFVEASYGQSTVSDTNFRQFGLTPFPQEDEDLVYYNASLGINLFPGEVFLGEKWAVGSAFYIRLGAGNVSFIGEDTSSFNFGFGLRLLTTDWLAFHINMEDLIYESDILGENSITHNFQLLTGVTVFF